MKNPSTISSGESDERAAFEAHMSRTFPGLDLALGKDGVYRIWRVENDWMLWQARAALATQPAPAEPVAPDTSAVWSAIADYVMATESLQRRRAAGHLMNAEWIDAVDKAVGAVDRAVLAAPLGAESKACASVGVGDPAEPKDDSDREYTRPIGYLPAYELGRLHSGHDANLRSAKFGPSPLDGDVPVYLCDAPALRALVAKWRHAAEHLGLEGLASLADCADALHAALATQPAESKACASVGVGPADAQIDAITQEWAGSIEVPRLRLDLCREYARRILKAFPSFTQETTMHTIAEDFEHFLAYTQNVPVDERLRLAYEHGAARGEPAPVARTCSDERMCINCFANQGACLGPYKPEAGGAP